MRDNAKACMIIFTLFLMLSLVMTSLVAAAGSITLNPNAQAPGSPVTVSGTSFGATKAVGIGLGAEVAATDYNMNYTGTGTGPYTGRVSKYPIKPGSFVLISDTTAGGSGIVSTYTDNGAGITIWSYDDTPMGTINYITGVWSRTTTVDVTGIVANYTATYKTYQYNVTPAAGVTTDASGTFSAGITVPATTANGVYNVTAIDVGGNLATSSLTVDAQIPEGLTIGVIVLLSSFAVIVGGKYFGKQIRIKN